MICLICRPSILLLLCIINKARLVEGGGGREKPPKKPNVMIIFADDVGTGDVPGYWNTGLVNMPNLQDLVANGTTFLDAHSTPLCAPSRYALLSGNYPHRGRKFGGTWRMNDEGSQFLPGQKSIAEVFQDNGYRTAMYGKWHLGGRMKQHVPLPNWSSKNAYQYYTEFALSNWTNPLIQGPSGIGFTESYITLEGLQSPPYAFLRNSTFEPEVLNNVKYWNKGEYSMPSGKSQIMKEGEGSEEWDSTAYNMILVNETRQFLEDHVKNKSDQPFFTHVSLGAVHDPHTPPYQYLDGSNIAGVYDTGHMDLLGEMDKVVGSLIKMLEERNLIEDTIIIFTSDNGGLGPIQGGSSKSGHHSSGPLRDSKGSIYEGGHRIPMIFRWDNGMIPKGESRDRLVGLNDVYATLCNFTGIEIPHAQAIDSISFADYAMDQINDHNIRESLGIWTWHNKDQISSAIRKENMKLILNHTMISEVQLYDLSKDLNETHNIASNNIDIVEELLQELKQISPCHDKKGAFKVHLPYKQKSINRSCKFFKKKSNRKSCWKYPEARLNCGWTCRAKKEKSTRKICRKIRASFKVFSNVKNTLYM